MLRASEIDAHKSPGRFLKEFRVAISKPMCMETEFLSPGKFGALEFIWEGKTNNVWDGDFFLS